MKLLSYTYRKLALLLFLLMVSFPMRDPCKKKPMPKSSRSGIPTRQSKTSISTKPVSYTHL